jgi:hypothetical protein
MNEKFLFNGKHKIPCKWKLFVATCNEIPKEEVSSPFWDRFMLKMTVNRVSAGELVKYFDKGARNYREKIKISVPDKTEISTVYVPTNKLEKYLEVGYQHSSDRTLTFVQFLKTFIFKINQKVLRQKILRGYISFSLRITKIFQILNILIASLKRFVSLNL